jgi:GT2 family glycosyltransferase
MERLTPRLDHDDHLIVPGVRGWLESPAPDEAVGDCVFIAGWMFSTTSGVRDIWVDVRGERRPLRTRLLRRDVAAAYPNEPSALESGFSAYLEFEGGPDRRPRSLAIHAALEDGRTIRLFRRRLRAPGTAPSPIASSWREAMSRPRLLVSPRAWRAGWRLLLRPISASMVQQPADVVGMFDRLSHAVLANFMASGAKLTLASSDSPRVSVIVPVWNRADLTLACLRALAAQTGVPFETIVVDNGSVDETAALMAHVDSVRAIRNGTNLGFTVAANLGAACARGEFLLFLNNDAELLPGALANLVDTARVIPNVGAIGGKLVFPDGRLQEAGSIIWADGSCEAYGRGGDPLAPEYAFERRVDFCSGALLLTPRAVFAELGGFDEGYAPAYYEDADYCVRLWTRGHPVVYQPAAIAVHREFGSSASPAAGIDLQHQRRGRFAAAHREWLTHQRSRDGDVLAARTHPHGAPSLIFVDDAAPDPRLGSGFPRAAAMIRAFRELGYLITVYATVAGVARPTDLLPGVEVVPGGAAGLRAFLAGRRGADLIVVSRPHNMQYVKAAAGADLAGVGAPCIYDAEAIFAARDFGRRELAGGPPADAERRAAVGAELGLARGCSAVLVVSAEEQSLFAAATASPVFLVGHAVDSAATTATADERRTMLFVGAFGPQSPNDDAVEFFVRSVLPLLRACGCSAPFVLAGAHAPDRLAMQNADGGIEVYADVDDLTPLYNDARVFVAPTRFGAGLPLKVIEAAAHGVPVVATTLVARQLGWESDVELLAADSAEDSAAAIAALCRDRELWMRVRDAALARVQRDHNVARFRSAIGEAIRAATAQRHSNPMTKRPNDQMTR